MPFRHAHRLETVITGALVGFALSIAPVLAAGDPEPPPAAAAPAPAHPPPAANSKSNSGMSTPKTKKKKNDQQSQQEYQEYIDGYKAARALVLDGKYEDAIQAFRALGHDDSAEVANYVGYAYRKLGDYELSKVWYDRALATDPDSPFGGIIIANRPWDLEFARAVDELFTEVLIGPDFSTEVLDFLRKKRNRRVMRFHREAINRSELDLKKVIGGLLVQTPDLNIEDAHQARVVTRRAPSEAELRAMNFGIRVCKHIKSNAIAFVAEDRTLAIGGGATSRIDPVYAAREKAGRLGVSLKDSVLVSEALFPFPDGPTLAAEAGATAIAQPGGSTRDAEVIEAADKFGLAMVFTGIRHFRH